MYILKQILGPGFDTSSREDNLLGTCQAGVFPTPELTEKTDEAKKLYNTATSSGYATKDYEPPIGEKVEKEPEPEFVRASAYNSTYVDDPTELPKFERPATAAAIMEKATSSGYASEDYEPKVGERVEKESEPVFASALRASTPGLAELERPVTAPNLKKEVQSTGYGQKWLPPVGEKFEREYYDSAGAAHFESVGDGDGGDDDVITAMPLVEDGGIVDEY